MCKLRWGECNRLGFLLILDVCIWEGGWHLDIFYALCLHSKSAA